MPENARRRKNALLPAVVVAVLLSGLYFITLSPKPYAGVDEAVVEKIAKEHGRESTGPLIDPGEGDLLLFLFLAAGAAGGFAAGYYWRDLTR